MWVSRLRWVSFVVAPVSVVFVFFPMLVLHFLVVISGGSALCVGHLSIFCGPFPISCMSYVMRSPVSLSLCFCNVGVVLGRCSFVLPRAVFVAPCLISIPVLLAIF